MTDLAAVCDELAYWLPQVGLLIAEHDTTAGTPTTGKPGSRPPWNQQAANAMFDALEEIRRTEQQIRASITGRPTVQRRPATQATRMLEQIPRLAEALSAGDRAWYTAQLTRRIHAIQTLPAIQHTEPWRRIPGAICPYCHGSVLLAKPSSGRVTCPRFGDCHDTTGSHPQGVVEMGATSATPLIAWADGVTQFPAA